MRFHRRRNSGSAGRSRSESAPNTEGSLAGSSSKAAAGASSASSTRVLEQRKRRRKSPLMRPTRAMRRCDLTHLARYQPQPPTMKRLAQRRCDVAAAIPAQFDDARFLARKPQRGRKTGCACRSRGRRGRNPRARCPAMQSAAPSGMRELGAPGERYRPRSRPPPATARTDMRPGGRRAPHPRWRCDRPGRGRRPRPH